MNPSSILIHRSLLQVTEADTASAGAALRRPFNPSSPFDSSMALTILVLLTALFFLGFFSAFIRRFATSPAEDPSPPSASLRRPPRPNRKGGLDISAVSSLPLVAYGKAARHPMIDDCPICLSEFFETETVKLIPYCSHVFHPRCIDTWLETHVTCPLCRSAQLFKSVEEICLDVTQDKNEISAREIVQRSTVENGDTSSHEGSDGVRRTCSCSDLAHQAVLQRSHSF